MKKARTIAIIIPVYNRKDITLCCLEQLQDILHEGFDFKIIVVDDGSTDGTAEAIERKFPEVKLLKGDGNLWWAGGINMGFHHAIDNEFDFVYTMNDDIVLSEDTLQNLYLAAKKHHAVYASMAVDPETGKITGSGYSIRGYLGKMRPLLKGVPHNRIKPAVLSVDALSSMSTLIPIDIILDAGFYDEKRFPHNYSDIDYSIRIKRKSYELFVEQTSVILSKGSGSNFHHILLSKTPIEILHSFFDIKYGYNIRTLFNSAIVRRNIVTAIPVFLNRLFPFLVWFGLSVFIPRRYLHKILKKTNRV